MRTETWLLSRLKTRTLKVTAEQEHRAKLSVYAELRLKADAEPDLAEVAKLAASKMSGGAP
jgi:hypothetical protein